MWIESSSDECSGRMTCSCYAFIEKTCPVVINQQPPLLSYLFYFLEYLLRQSVYMIAARSRPTWYAFPSCKFHGGIFLQCSFRANHSIMVFIVCRDVASVNVCLELRWIPYRMGTASIRGEELGDIVVKGPWPFNEHLYTLKYLPRGLSFINT